MGLALNSGL